MNQQAVLFLAIAIVMEVIATTALKLSDSFTRLLPSVVAILGYCIAFWCLTIPMKSIPTGIIYAIWSGVGIVMIGAVGWLFLGQKLDFPAMLGMLMIIGGVVVINLFSKASPTKGYPSGSEPDG
jgi:small multidrug resistance pump